MLLACAGVLDLQRMQLVMKAMGYVEIASVSLKQARFHFIP